MVLSCRLRSGSLAGRRELELLVAASRPVAQRARERTAAAVRSLRRQTSRPRSSSARLNAASGPSGPASRCRSSRSWKRRPSPCSLDARRTRARSCGRRAPAAGRSRTSTPPARRSRRRRAADRDRISSSGTAPSKYSTRSSRAAPPAVLGHGSRPSRVPSLGIVVRNERRRGSARRLADPVTMRSASCGVAARVNRSSPSSTSHGSVASRHGGDPIAELRRASSSSRSRNSSCSAGRGQRRGCCKRLENSCARPPPPAGPAPRCRSGGSGGSGFRRSGSRRGRSGRARPRGSTASGADPGGCTSSRPWRCAR